MISNEIKVQGKSAVQRMEVLENYVPDIYMAMLESGSFEAEDQCTEYG